MYLNDNSHFTQLQNNRTCSPLKGHAHMAHVHTSKDTCTDTSFGSSRPISAFSQWYFQISLYMAVQTITTASFNFLHNIQHWDYIMNATDYWLFTREYSRWNATIATWKFWTADLEPHVLSSTIEQVYNAFFYTTSMHLLCQQPEEALFSCFVTMLNAANWHWKMKDMRVEVKISTYPLLSDGLQSPPCFQWWKHLLWPFYTMHHSYQPVMSQACTPPLIIQ